MVEGAVDWDAALVGALPRAFAAKDEDEFAAAVQVMVAALRDPATRVEHEVETVLAAATAPVASSRTIDGVLVVRVAASGWQGVEPEAARIEPEIEKAPLVVLDVRATTRDDASGAQLVVDKIAARLPSHDAIGIAQQFVEHRGYKPQTGVTSGQYATLLAATLPLTFVASKQPHPSRVVFVTNTMTGVPDLAWAMQRTGDAAIVLQGPMAPDEFAATRLVSLPGGYELHLRDAEPVGDALRVDVELGASASDDDVTKAALGVAHRKHGAATHAVASAKPRTMTWRPDATYADEPYPSRERRMLALFRFWSVIRYFYPYLPLMGDTWGEALREFIPRFEEAADAHDYVLAVAEFLAAKIPDGHVGVWGSKELRTIFGAARQPFQAQMVEGHPTVTSLLGDTSLAAAGLAVGDVIVTIDGEPIATRVARLAKYTTASTDAWRGFRTLRSALTGDVGSTMKLTVQGADGKVRGVEVPRTKNWSPAERTGAVYRLLDDGIGYVDLDRLENGDVDAMFNAFEKTHAIVFDMRGYPHGTAWSIAPRINTRHARFAAQFFEPFVSTGSTELTFFRQGISHTSKPLYAGKTVMLVDERTMSQAEHTGLFFEAANGTTFIGSQTAGANGDVTNLTLPAGLSVSFSGHDVRHADGRQLQRVGLVPDIEVHPTLAGVRAGRDEVLERAVAYLHTGR